MLLRNVFIKLYSLIHNIDVVIIDSLWKGRQKLGHQANQAQCCALRGVSTCASVSALVSTLASALVSASSIHSVLF